MVLVRVLFLVLIKVMPLIGNLVNVGNIVLLIWCGCMVKGYGINLIKMDINVIYVRKNFYLEKINVF